MNTDQNTVPLSPTELEAFLAFKASKAAAMKVKPSLTLEEQKQKAALLATGSVIREVGPKNKGVWFRVEIKIKEGKSNAEILREVCSEQGNSKTTMTCIKWYRTMFNKTGTCLRIRQLV